MSLTEFLLARIAEDEREANVMMRQYREGGEVSARRWRRVLAECEAKRRIVELVGGGLDVHQPHACQDCDVLRALALPYADHDDYREAWKP